MAWKGVITNGGNELLTQWTSGKTLTITRAAAGTGRVSEIAMLAQTALVSEKQTASILSNTAVDNGQRLRLQVSPLDAAYALNQFGVFAQLDGGDEMMIALFQTDTDSGIEIPGSEEMPDFVYTFYGLLAFSNTGGELTVTIDSNAYVTQEQLEEALNGAGKPATAETLGSVMIGENLVVTEDGVVSVDTVDAVTAGDTRPVTAGAVYAELESIVSLLAAI